jgi:glycosyltransferase involved in cell wall biosynthesis
VSRVPHLLHIFSTFVPAGPEIRTVRLMNALGGDWRHSIVALDGRVEAAELLKSKTPATVLARPPRAASLPTVRALRAIIRREQPDLCLSYNWGAFDAVIASRSLGRGRRHLHHEDGFNADEAMSFRARREWARRILLPGVARVVVPSRNLEDIARKRWKLKAKQVALVPNGIDLAAFAESSDALELRRTAGIPKGALVVGFVGHLRPVKQPLRLLRAVMRARGELHLLVLGAGELSASLEAEACSLGCEDRLHLVGHQRDTAPWYSAMDLFALSSDSEQMPVALLEAMAAGLAVVATDVGDVAHILPPEQGDLILPLPDNDARGDAQDSLEGALAKALETLAGDAAQRQHMGELNRARVAECYGFESMLAAYRSIYRTALESAKP